MQPSKTRADFWMDVALMGFLIALDVAARLLPHAPGAWPVAATALFAGRTFRIPALASTERAKKRPTATPSPFRPRAACLLMYRLLRL